MEAPDLFTSRCGVGSCAPASRAAPPPRLLPPPQPHHRVLPAPGCGGSLPAAALRVPEQERARKPSSLLLSCRPDQISFFLQSLLPECQERLPVPACSAFILRLPQTMFPFKPRRQRARRRSPRPRRGTRVVLAKRITSPSPPAMEEPVGSLTPTPLGPAACVAGAESVCRAWRRFPAVCTDLATAYSTSRYLAWKWGRSTLLVTLTEPVAQLCWSVRKRKPS